MSIPRTQTVIDIDGSPVEIKSRMEDGRWAVIAFTGSHSIRSTKLSVIGGRESFARAVVHSIIDVDLLDPEDWQLVPDGIKKVEDAVLLVTNNFTV